MKGVAMATNESTHVDPTEDDAIDEANEQAAKESRRYALKLSLKIAVCVLVPMVLIAISVTAFTGGVVIAWIQVLLLPLVAGVVQFRRSKKWNNRPITDPWRFWLLAWVPAVLMIVVYRVVTWFINIGYWTAWWFGEKYSIANLYFSVSGGFFGNWSWVYALAILLLGMIAYSQILVLITRSLYPSTVSGWIGRLVLLPIVATLPILIIIGIGANNMLAGF